MRRGAWVLVASLACLVVALLLIDRFATRVAESDAGRRWIITNASGLIGRDVTYSHASVRLLPPAVVVHELHVMGADADAQMLFEADRARLRLAVWPLLSGDVVVDDIEVKRPVLRLERTDAGYALPGAGGGAAAPGAGAARLPNSLRLTGVRVEFSDRTAAAALPWVIDGVDVVWRRAATGVAGDLQFDGAGAVLKRGDWSVDAGSGPARIGAHLRLASGELAISGIELALGSFTGTGTAELGQRGNASLSGAFALASGSWPISAQAQQDPGRDTWQLQLSSKASGLRFEQVLAALGVEQDDLLGSLDLDAQLQATLPSSKSLAEAPTGRARLVIAPGRLTGVSILAATLRALERPLQRQVLDRLPLPRLEGPLSKGLESHDTDTFESLSATLAIGGGVAHTDDFRLVTTSYVFTMRGDIRLTDLGLDAVGELRLGGGLAGALATRLGAKRLAHVGEFVIPIPRLGGTLLDPKPEPDVSVLWRLLTETLPGVREAGDLLRGVGGLLDPREK